MFFREVKFGALIDRLASDGEWLATGVVLHALRLFYTSLNPSDNVIGHYARKGWKVPPGSSIPRPQLLRSSDPTKDQNYYLSAIPEKGLERALFPLGELTKTEIREIAKTAGLPTAQRAESMGICFVGQKRKFDEFLGEYDPLCSSRILVLTSVDPYAANYLESDPGPIRDLETGAILGTHQGLWTFTIGQGARIPGSKHFVASKNKEENAIYVVNSSFVLVLTLSPHLHDFNLLAS